MARENEWMAYYDRFASYFSPDAVRDGCYPRIVEGPAPAAKAIVLVHGLTDSPHFVAAIGKHFHEKLGYNVYMPLLHCHGLKKPRGPLRCRDRDRGIWCALSSLLLMDLHDLRDLSAIPKDVIHVRRGSVPVCVIPHPTGDGLD